MPQSPVFVGQTRQHPGMSLTTHLLNVDGDTIVRVETPDVTLDIPQRIIDTILAERWDSAAEIDAELRTRMRRAFLDQSPVDLVDLHGRERTWVRACDAADQSDQTPVLRWSQEGSWFIAVHGAPNVALGRAYWADLDAVNSLATQMHDPAALLSLGVLLHRDEFAPLLERARLNAATGTPGFPTMSNSPVRAALSAAGLTGVPASSPARLRTLTVPRAADATVAVAVAVAVTPPHDADAPSVLPAWVAAAQLTLAGAGWAVIDLPAPGRPHPGTSADAHAATFWVTRISLDTWADISVTVTGHVAAFDMRSSTTV